MQVTFTDRLPDGCYMCWLGDYDLDIITGYGRTKEEAETDLWDQLEETVECNPDCPNTCDCA